jgi:hypothetical protein
MDHPDEPALSLSHDGAERCDGAAAAALADIRRALAHLPPDQAGLRITGIEALRPLLAASGPIGAVAAASLGQRARAVRAILFDKTAATNWALGWHQDRTISVVERLDVTGFGPWTIKRGMPHVAPPFALLSRMVTLRVHLDDTPSTNAPLLIAPGSHRLGCVPVSDIDAAVQTCGIGDEHQPLFEAFNRNDVAACLASLLIQGRTGPMSTTLRYALRTSAIDVHLDDIARDAVQPSVRAVALETLIEGRAKWPAGYGWEWIDKSMGLGRQVTIFDHRALDVVPSRDLLISRGIRDRSPVVRRVALDGVMRHMLSTREGQDCAALLAEDRSPPVRERAAFILRPR